MLSFAISIALLSVASIDGHAEPISEEAARSAHARMVEDLAAVHERARVHNRYLGSALVDALREELDALPAEARGPRAITLRLHLGQELLRMGATAEAIAVLRAADEMCMEGGLPENPGKRGGTLDPDEVVFALGTAYLRLGEDENCCLTSSPESCILPIQGGGLHSKPEGSERAIRCFERVLENQRPNAPLGRKARWLLNVAYMTLGRYPEGVGERDLIDPSIFAADQDFPHFQDVAMDVGLDQEGLAGGLVAEDFDGDGDLDLMISSSDTGDPVRLYLNDGAGGFQDATEAAGLQGILGGLNLVSGDHDGDGDVDVLVLRGAWWGVEGNHPNSLLQNDGRGGFLDVTHAVGLGESRYPTQTAAFADYDNDGDLDLYVGNESRGDQPAPGELFQNDGTGRFTEVAAAAGVTNDRFAKAVSWGDYDGDGFPDLYVSNMGGANRLYRNLGDGTFRDVAEECGVQEPVSGFPAWFFDFDNDGDQDLFAASYGGAGVEPSVAHVAASYLGQRHKGDRMRLYVNDGAGGFEERGEELGLGRFTLPMGANFGDVDGDGFLDMYLGTGYPLYEGLMPNVMLRNVQGEGFEDVTMAGGFGHLQKGHGVAFADLDGDGDQDVACRVGGAYPGDGFRPVFFRNPGQGAHWLQVKLEGVASNSFGIGARLLVELGLEDEVTGELVTRTLHRTVGTGGSFGCNSLRQEIGLGRAFSVERLVVEWPTSGVRQEFLDVPMNSHVVVREDGIGIDALRLVPSWTTPGQ